MTRLFSYVLGQIGRLPQQSDLGQRTERGPKVCRGQLRPRGPVAGLRPRTVDSVQDAVAGGGQGQEEVGQEGDAGQGQGGGQSGGQLSQVSTSG